MKYVNLRRDQNVMVLTMNHKGSNSLNPDFVGELRLALAETGADPAVGALVVTGGDEKFFCTGLDVDWIKGNFSAAKDFLSEMNALFTELLLFPAPTIACINGHAYAGGAVLAFLMDYRFMRRDRGFLRCPEVTIGVSFPRAVAKVVEKVVSPRVARDMILMAKKYDGPEALKDGLVDGVFSREDLLPGAVGFAWENAQPDRRVFGRIKQSMYGDLAGLIRDEDWEAFINFSFGS
ncbi:MAG: enoyl-CoA hydratase/isomerase family protein [Bacillota bacterium]|jgi:enoyl-CoA hydratase/carnithine racemase